MQSGLLILRVGLGVLLVVHGSQKLGLLPGRGPRAFAVGLEKMGIRPGYPLALLAGATQVGGGTLVALGLLGPVGPLSLAGSMMVAVAVLRRNGFWSMRGGYEYAAVLVLVFTVLALTGPGRFSLDAAVGFKPTEPWTLLGCAVAAVAGVALTLMSGRRAGVSSSDVAAAER